MPTVFPPLSLRTTFWVLHFLIIMRYFLFCCVLFIIHLFLRLHGFWIDCCFSFYGNSASCLPINRYFIIAGIWKFNFKHISAIGKRIARKRITYEPRLKETGILYLSGCKNRRVKLKIHVSAGGKHMCQAKNSEALKTEM